MKGVLRVAIVDPQEDSREALKDILLGMDMVWLEAESSTLDHFYETVAQTRPDLAIVSLEPDPDDSLDLTSRLAAEFPEMSVLVTSDSNDSNMILNALRAGAKEFLRQPVELDELVNALGRLTASGTGRGPAAGSGSQVFSVCGAMGGVGTTTIAINLAAALAENPDNVVALVDLDLALGDADVCLDLVPDYTLADVAQNISRLDFTLLKRSLTKHESGLFLLPRPNDLDEVSLINAEQLRRVIGLLKATFTHVVLDTSKSYLPTDMVAFELSDIVLCVAQLDLSSLRNLVRTVMWMSKNPQIDEKLRIVLNRLGLEDGEISTKKAEETIGREIFAQLPNDYKAVSSARNDGVPLVIHSPRSKVAQNIVKLASSISGQDREVLRPVKAKRGFLSFLS